MRARGPNTRFLSPIALSILALLAFASVAACTAAAQGQERSITLPLSPTALNVFNFGIHSFKVQYPPGTEFSDVFMTVTAVELSESGFKERVAGTRFFGSTCIVYTGESGNCIDYQVICSNASGQIIPCPPSSPAAISIETSYYTQQTVTNPGFLHAPTGTNSWTNIFDEFFLTRIDPTTHGHTNGYSEFVAVALGATDAQGPVTLTFNAPLRNQDPRSFPVGTEIPVSFILRSTEHSAEVTDATAGLTVLMVAEPNGIRTSVVKFARQNAFVFSHGEYSFLLPCQHFPPGSYVLTVFGNAFPSTAISFTIR